MVEKSDAAKRCARSRERGLQTQEPAGDRLLAQAERRTKQAPQVAAVPLGDVDAGVLRKPRRKEPLRRGSEKARQGERRAAQAVRQEMTTARCTRGRSTS